ncbi:MAG: 50S ribosomal protein L11 methyltransferase [Pseudomonadota bacterium]
MSTTYKLSIEVEDGHQVMLSNVFEEILQAQAVGLAKLPDLDISKNEAPHPKRPWKLEAYFEYPPNINDIKGILVDIFGSQLPCTTPDVEKLADEDWVAKVQSHLCPVHVGRFIIHGSHDSCSLRGRPYAIEIEAGQAFGTAHHGTTQGCLHALEIVLKKQPLCNILDLGTGSGILAIAAAKMQPHANITASDIDPIAIRVAQENFRINSVSHLITPCCAEGLNAAALRNKRPFDMVIANILAKPLQQIAYNVSQALCVSGTLILSGILKEQAQSVCAKYCNVGFVLQRSIFKEGWVTLILQKYYKK